MFFQLFLKECRQTLKSIIFYFYVIILVFFWVSQMSSSEFPKEPKAGQENYGYQYSQDKERIMEGTLGQLFTETFREQYSAYPFGFYKSVKLNDADHDKVVKILEKASGKSWEELLQIMEAHAQEQEAGAEEESDARRLQYHMNISPAPKLSYKEFQSMMKEVEDLVGAGSNYAESLLYKNADEPISYEDAKASYEAILKEDRVSGATARLFCDYMGIVLGILPVFLAVFRGLHDKRSQADAVIFARKSTSVCIIGARYAATLFMCLIPVFALSISPMMESLYLGEAVNASVDILAYGKYILGWLVPTITTAIAIGYFFCAVTESALGILVQGILWIVTLFMGLGRGTLVGDFGLQLVARWNTLGETEKFAQQFGALVSNRVFYLILSFLLFVGTVVFFELRRKGVWQFHGSLLRNRKSKSED